MPTPRSRRKSGASETPVDSTTSQCHTTTSPPAGTKRKVEEDSDTGIPPPSKSQKTFTKSETHWNLDGSLLLQIGNARFKVHRSRLTSESPWFAALIDQRNGLLPEDTYEDQAEIDQVLSTVENVDGIDLFFLDIECSDFPDAEAFSMLLTAMNRGINFVYDPPKREEIVLLYRAASFYQMEIYQTFCERYFLSVFPDTGQLLPLSPSIDLAVQGILLGREYSTLSAILRPAFYDLARAPLFDYEPKPTRKHSATNTSQGLDPLESGTILRQAITNDAVQGETLHPLARLPSRDLIALLDLQKRLSLTWDGIFDALNYICRTDRCRSTHCAKVQAIKMECPYDPILGVQHILDRTAFTKSYCEEAAKEVKRLLKAERDGIWDDIRDWLGVSDGDNI